MVPALMARAASQGLGRMSRCSPRLCFLRRQRCVPSRASLPLSSLAKGRQLCEAWLCGSSRYCKVSRKEKQLSHGRLCHVNNPPSSTDTADPNLGWVFGQSFIASVPPPSHTCWTSEVGGNSSLPSAAGSLDLNSHLLYSSCLDKRALTEQGYPRMANPCLPVRQNRVRAAGHVWDRFAKTPHCKASGRAASLTRWLEATRTSAA